MQKYSSFFIVGIALAGLFSKGAWASPTNEGKSIIERDQAYEQDLKWEASADKTITPAKVMRWVMNMRGQSLGPPSKTEFQPIVNVNESKVRVIAAIAYKF